MHKRCRQVDIHHPIDIDVDGVTVGALAHADTLRQVLGGGAPRVAYNALKHILIEGGDSLPLVAASYSLGYASDGPTHLARLDDFGLTYGYDQRHGRRYSDRGITELSRCIATEWTIEASPTLTVTLRQADESLIEATIATEHLVAIEMREPLIELVSPDGEREAVATEWSEPNGGSDSHTALLTNIAWNTNANDALSLLWNGELWPRFHVCGPLASHLCATTLAARLFLYIRKAQHPATTHHDQPGIW